MVAELQKPWLILAAMAHRVTEIELYKESFKFSCGHFTIFSATERENLHGHNFMVKVSFLAAVNDNGMTFDYGKAKQHIEQMCKDLNEITLLPEHSKFLTFVPDGAYLNVTFNDETLIFLQRDIRLLPITNITVEELSQYFLQEFVSSFVAGKHEQIEHITVRVFSGPGQSGSASWQAS